MWLRNYEQRRPVHHREDGCCEDGAVCAGDPDGGADGWPYFFKAVPATTMVITAASIELIRSVCLDMLHAESGASALERP